MVNIHEILFLIVLVIVTSYLTFVGWYPQAVASGLFFILCLGMVLARSLADVLAHPLPRINIQLDHFPQEKEEETETPEQN